MAYRLASLVGQASLKKAIYSQIAAAGPRGVIPHQLFIGPDGIGKRTFAESIANETNASCSILSIGTRTIKLDIGFIISNVRRREIVILENIQCIPEEAEDMLPPLFEHSRLDILIGKRFHSVKMPKFTMIGTCSDPGELSEDLRSLFSIKTTFEPYSKSEFRDLLPTMQTHALERIADEEQRWVSGAGSRFHKFVECYSPKFVPGDVIRAVDSFTVPPDAIRLRQQSSGPRVLASATRINSMSPKPRGILRGLIETYGNTLLDDPRRCEALLRDLCRDHKREISVLVSAIRERVPTEILAPSHLLPAQCLYERLASRLEENLALSPDASRWAVSAWTFALNRQEPIWDQPTPGAARKH